MMFTVLSDHLKSLEKYESIWTTMQSHQHEKGAKSRVKSRRVKFAALVETEHLTAEVRRTQRVSRLSVAIRQLI